MGHAGSNSTSCNGDKTMKKQAIILTICIMIGACFLMSPVMAASGGASPSQMNPPDRGSGTYQNGGSQDPGSMGPGTMGAAPDGNNGQQQNRAGPGGNATVTRQGNFTPGSDSGFAPPDGFGNQTRFERGNMTRAFNGTFPDGNNPWGNQTWTNNGEMTPPLNGTFTGPANGTHWQNMSVNGNENPGARNANGAGQNQPVADSVNPDVKNEIESLIAALNNLLKGLS